MNFALNKYCLCLLVATIAVTDAFAQKVDVGYDKGTDFSRYTSYTWGEPARTPTRPLLYASIVGSIDHELKAKGLARRDSGGDLILIPAGGIDFGMAGAAGMPITSTYGGAPIAFDATMWSGAGGSGALTSTYVTEGTLVLEFLDRKTNKIVWTGTAKQKVDLENKQKALDRIDKAIAKLLKQFPPQKK
jgi:hypothetical protein